jgi:hypothetical protein
MYRTVSRFGLGLALVVGLAKPAAAQVVHSIDFNVGAWVPSGVASRDAHDVLLANMPALVFKISDFKSVDVQGEWNVAFGDHIEAGFGLGYLQGHARPFYRDVIDGRTNSDIFQDNYLRVIPFQAVVRFLPFGKMGKFQPYVGAGVGVLRWRYTEVGDFVDSSFTIFSARYASSGTAVGPILLGGAKVPLGGDIYALTLELRYQDGLGTLDPTQKFAGSKIDLSGLSTKFGFLVRF